MPERETIERAQEDAREGKSPSTQAGEFVREQILLNSVDQLRNIDRLRQHRMPLNVEASLCLGFRDT